MTALLAFGPQAVYRPPTRPGVVNPSLTRVLLTPRTRSVVVKGFQRRDASPRTRSVVVKTPSGEKYDHLTMYTGVVNGHVRLLQTRLLARAAIRLSTCESFSYSLARRQLPARLRTIGRSIHRPPMLWALPIRRLLLS